MAVLAGIRSGQVRRERAGLKPKHEPDRATVNVVQQTVNAQLNIVREQLTRTRSVLNDTEYRYCEHCERGGIEPQHRAQLIKSLDVLMDRQRKLMGIPDPGPRRAQPADDRRTAPAAAWIEDSIDVHQVAPPAAPHLEPEPPAGPVAPTAPTADTTTGGGQAENQLPETPAP